MADELTEAARKRLTERFEQLGLEAVKDDLRDGGFHLIGGPLQNREYARASARMKEEAERDAAHKSALEAVTLKPGLYGVSVDLKEVAGRVRKRWRRPLPPDASE